MTLASRGYTSSARVSGAPGAYISIRPTDFGSIGGSPNANLGVAGAYAILAQSGITNSGLTVVKGGNIGSAPTATITGFPPGVVVAPNIIDNADAAAAETAAIAAYATYNALSFTSLGSAVNMSTNTGGGGGAGVYRAGNYSSTSSLDIPATVNADGNPGITLDAQGNPAALFVFKSTASTVTLETGASVTLINGAQADNVIWLVGSSLTTVAPSNMVGTILAQASITLGGGTFVGHAFAGLQNSGAGAVSISTATAITTETTFPVNIQNALPLVPANGTADYIFVIPNAGSEWKVQKSVQFMRPNGVAETPGIAIDGLDCIQPPYPGQGATVVAGTSPVSYMELNGYGFVATTGGTTAVTFIGFSNFNVTKGATTQDGTVVWTSLGKVALVRARFTNSGLVAASPVAQEYDLFEL
jgi:hypothetical protein